MLAAAVVCCKPTYRYPVNELPPLYVYTSRPHGAGIAHARNVNVGTGIGERVSEPLRYFEELRTSSAEKGRRSFSQ